jgi:large repetitive protein
MFTTLKTSLEWGQASRAALHALALSALFLFAGCDARTAASSTPEPVLASQALGLVGDGKLQPGEQCDDGNTVSGDGCSSTGTVEAGYLCHVPGNPCSLASLCGNNVTDTGELCDDGNTVDNGNGCSASCDLSLCGNGAFDNRQYPSFAQEVCDDGNRFEGDGCSRQCEVEPGFACAGSPSRCVRAGVAVFNTGVDAQNRRLPPGGVDTHWFYAGTTTGADTGVRNANDWPLEMQTARFMAPRGGQTCVYQDFLVPSTTNISQFRLRLATFNDNQFDSAKVNGVSFTPVTVSEPPGQPWQKNIFREFGTTAAWHAGINRIELCNENAASPPNAFRYLFVDAYDDRCGDGALSPREECDDGNTANGDGCSATCGIEPGYGCTGQPSACAKTCGNGNLNPGEQCDDGNVTGGDGCNASCRVEAGYACPTPGQACVATCGNGAVDPGEQCDDGNTFGSDGCSASCRVETGYTCSGSPSTCAPLCGNGVLDPGELCDDGNTALGDGCSNACTLEAGYACATPGQPCAKTCGNGNVDPGEQCDDGNLTSGDGCATECRVESGYSCTTPSNGPSVCAQTCGNGNVEPGDQCDDGNLTSNDGCSNGCRVETGWSCSGVPSACATVCGDGLRAGAETCDDGNTTAGDGCSATCTVEPGWSCPAPGTVCFNTCGNGIVDAGETCDDGNTVSGDGCAATCTVESGYTCSGAPSACGTTCGDGIRAGAEVCDDGNLVGGDTCSPRCLLEVGQPCNASNVCDAVCNPVIQQCVAALACGNGFLEEGELCDDGNTTGGDGCDATCGIEAGFSCSGSNPSACAVTCGDGVRAASEACDDGNTTPGDGCSATCTVEAGSGCKNSDVRVFVALLGREDCTSVADLAAPVLPAGAVQAGLPVPGRYRIAYTVGAVQYAGGASWQPGIFGVQFTPATTAQGFSLGNLQPASGSWAEAVARGFTQRRDFDAASGDVRVALIDTDCSDGNNTNTEVTYRVDALSICQRLPAITHPAQGGHTGPSIGGTASPGASVTVYVDGSATPACTAIADANGQWTCTLTGVPDGEHTATVTATVLGATETGTPVDFVLGQEPAPAAPVITGPASGAALNTATPAISGTGTPGSLVTVREGSTVLCTATVDATGAWRCVPTAPLAEGPHAVTATAETPFGGTSPVSNTQPFTVDTVAPDTLVVEGPGGPSGRTTSRTADFEYHSTEQGSTFECSLDGGAWAPCQDRYTVGVGDHVLRVRAVDGVGNTDATPAEYRWTVVSTRALAGGGCSAAPDASWLALLGLLGVPGLRRRSRR